MEPVSILTVIGLIGSITLVVLKEFFSAKAKAREKKEKFNMEYKDFLRTIEGHLVKLKEESKRDSQTARDLEEKL